VSKKITYLAFGAVLLALGFPVDAQQPTVPRIGWISNDRSSSNSAMFDAFREGLRDLGYVEGRNLIIEARWGEGSNERLEQLAAELVRSNPQLIVTQGGPSTYPVLRAGPNMPIVFGFSGDPVEGKLVESFARPGRNLTGVSFLSLELVGKRMELLKEVLPALKRVAILANPQHPGEQSEFQASQAAAKTLGLTLEYFQLPTKSKLEDLLPAIAKSRGEAIVVFPDAYMMGYSQRIAAFAVKSRMPAISGWAQFAEGGNLMTYGPNLRDSYRRLATYVDKILKGAKPSDLPVELPMKLELVINLKAAKQIGVTIPPNVLARADKVIR
jgi:putative ABC transport system substrate-binding protein